MDAMIGYMLSRSGSVNMWVDIETDFLIGPYLLPHRLNSKTYCNFLEKTFRDTSSTPIDTYKDIIAKLSIVAAIVCEMPGIFERVGNVHF
ncbi:hypothetical protein CEXT_325151 [Caerostris extrusa]|uniref:Uncharacterized protein n=1 Tax=Caerostris extrusa TaxID=172846 RepID=A0AAV4XRB2_CAEEX|nr:hypothetical protein CEXT_325151 [Caerostris extrusa]